MTRIIRIRYGRLKKNAAPPRRGEKRGDQV
jgi:hypothetical protein